MIVSSELKRRSDQFDIRLNCETDERLDEIVDICYRLYAFEQVRYIHCSGMEIGDVPGRGSFGKKHVHIALCFENARTVMSICKKFKCQENDESWYIVPRNKALPLDGWIRYHSKQRTKIDPSIDFIMQQGVLPSSKSGHTSAATSSESSAEADKVTERYLKWKRRETLVKMHDWDQLDIEFPGFQYTSACRSMRSKFNKQSNKFVKNIDGALQNYIIYGDSGTGKSSSIALLYPNCYKKQKGSQYWDGYDIDNPDHQVVWIDEMSKETLATMTGKIDGGFEFLKELADRYPVTVDEKYQVAFKIRPRSLIITMNEYPTTLLPDRAVEVNKRALFRKFRILHVSDWLIMHGLENTPHGVRHLPIFESDEEIKGEHDFNQQRRNGDTQRQKRSCPEIDRCNQRLQKAAKGTLSYVLHN